MRCEFGAGVHKQVNKQLNEPVKQCNVVLVSSPQLEV